MKRFLRKTGPVPAFAIFLALWSFFSWFIQTIPPIHLFWVALVEWIAQGKFFIDLSASLGRAFVGLFLGAFFGVLIGFLTGRIHLLYQLIGPILHGFRACPAVAIAPFLILILGNTGEEMKVGIITFGVFFPVWINTHEGAGQVNHVYIDVAKDLGLNPFQVYRHVIGPATISFIIAGIRNGIGMAYIMVFIAEWIAANKGVGYFLSIAHVVSSPEHMAVGLATLGLLAFLSDMIYRNIVRYLFPWLDLSYG